MKCAVVFYITACSALFTPTTSLQELLHSACCSTKFYSCHSRDLLQSEVISYGTKPLCPILPSVGADCLPLCPLPHAAPCRRRWCSTLGPTRTTSSTYTTACEASCWTWATASRASCSRCGTKARTFPWRLAHHLTSCLPKIKLCSTNLHPLAPHFLLLLSYFHNFMPRSPRLTVVTIPRRVLSSMQRYMKPIYTEESYLELQRRQKRTFNTQQLTAFRLLFAWRDKLARQEDESTGWGCAEADGRTGAPPPLFGPHLSEKLQKQFVF